MFVQGTLKTNALVPVVAAALIVNNYDCARIGYLPFRGPGFYTLKHKAIAQKLIDLPGRGHVWHFSIDRMIFTRLLVAWLSDSAAVIIICSSLSLISTYPTFGRETTSPLYALSMIN